MSKLLGAVKRPEKGEEVRITDSSHKYFDKVGVKIASRPDGKVLVWIPATPKLGYLTQFDWTQCKRV